MTQHSVSQWRTVGVAVFASLLLFAAFLVAIVRAGVPLDLGKA